MPEEAGAVLEKVPDDQDVQSEDDRNGPGEAGVGGDFTALDQFVVVHEFEYFDGYEKRRFANRHPAGPGCAKYQTDAFHERKKTIEERAGRDRPHVSGFNRVEVVADVRQEAIFRIEMNEFDDAVKQSADVPARHPINAKRQQQRQRAFYHFEDDDEIERGGALFLNGGFFNWNLVGHEWW